MEKKRLILVGNKPVNKEGLPEIVDSFDYVVRVNRMTNLGSTGNKIDACYIGAWPDFKYKYKGGEHKDLYRTIPHIFMVESAYRFFKEYPDYITEDQYRNVELLDTSYNLEHIGTIRATSTIRVLDYLLSSHWSEEYDISITGIDVEGRGELFIKDPTWNTTGHIYAGYAEESYLSRLIEEGRITRIMDE